MMMMIITNTTLMTYKPIGLIAVYSNINTYILAENEGF